MLRALTVKLIALAALAMAPVWPALCQGHPATDTPAAEKPSSQELKARQIRDLIAGKLDADVDAAELFSFSLTSRDAPRLRAVAQLVADKTLFSRATGDPSLLAPLPEDTTKLALAEAAFLRLPKAQRERLLNAHRKRYDALRDTARSRDAKEAELSRLHRELQSLEDFIQGKPASAAVLKLNLLDKQTGRFDAGDFEALTGDTVQAGKEPAPDAPIEERIEWLRGRIALAKRTIFELPPGRLAQMEAAAGITSGTADEIARADAKLDAAKSELTQAAQAAINAASEQERLAASEQARLLQTKNVQAEFRSRLARSRDEPDEIWETALGWRRNVQDLIRTDEGREERADQFYLELVGELNQVRGRLHQALEKSDSIRISGLEPPPLDPALPEESPGTKQLLEQKASLSSEAERLRARYADQLWAKRRALRDAMVLLNGERLALIPVLSRGKRADVTGFGAEGVAQVRREFSEIYLELRFSLQSWKKSLADLARPFLRPTPGFVLAMLRLILIALAFSWWRRHGDPILQRAQTEYENRRPRKIFTTFQASFLEYWRRVRRPLDWLLFALLVWWLSPADLVIPGGSLIWIILFWSLTTFLIVNLVDQLARGRGKEDPRAELRWNSLRLIAGSLLAIGLLLNLTRASVGKGAVYNWVYTLSWLLVPAILVLLANWWRSRIVTLSASEAKGSALLGWISRDPGGLIGLLGRIAAGTLLLLKGLQLIVTRRMRDLALVRDVFEQRARVEAARQVAKDKASGRFRRLPEEVLDTLDPHRMPAELRHGEDRPGGLDLPTLVPGTFNLIVGERGLGKSAFLRDLTKEVGAECEVIRLSVDSRAFDGVLQDLSEALGCEAPVQQPEVLALLLAQRGAPCLIAIDDIQRLIVPAIGGLTAIDNLVAMARASGNTCRWAFTIGDQAWDYLQRARVDRVLFDSVLRLPSWKASELRALIERRTAQAGIQPDFSTMVDDGVFELGEDLTPDERKQRGYFDRLTEYVNGNPAIALDYWRRSLFVDSVSQQVVVRTFDTAAVGQLSSLPMAALFVLRAIMQMDVAESASIQASTDLSPTVVADALRSLERIGAIVRFGGSFRIALHWWREVTRLLQRQNLIVKGAK